MTVSRSIHRCGACGSSSPRWTGRCALCGAWNTLVEEREPAHAHGFAGRGGSERALGMRLEAVELSSLGIDAGQPLPTGVRELDRALGGGLVAGSVTLVGGEPGIGKSTLLLQAAAAVGARGRALVVAAEEAVEQVALRARRLGLATGGVSVISTTSLPDAIATSEHLAPDLLIVDSVQTVADPDVAGSAGSVTQVREAAQRVVAYSKSSGVRSVLVGHVTKEGSLAGPRVLEHLVDTVCTFEGDRHHALRILAVTKHRFGPTGELGVFKMTSAGLEGVEDPSGLLLADRRPGVAGGIVLPVLEGRRPLLVELQALVARSALATPRRAAQGIAPSRLAMVLAVIERRLGVPLGTSDVFVSVVGGVKVAEPAADLAVALALVSSIGGQCVGDDIVACGEIGLGGELRQVAHFERRLAEAARLGFRRAIVPRSASRPHGEIELVRAATLAEAVTRLELIEGIRAGNVLAGARLGPVLGRG